MADYCAAFVRVPGSVAEIRRFVETHELEGVRAPDDRTLVFHLVAPAADFLNLLAMSFAAPVPEEYLAYLPDGPDSRRNTLSNGPYAITRYEQNRRIELARNPAWDASADPIRPAHVDRIEIQLGIDDQLTQLQLEAGSADLGFDLSMPTADQASLRGLRDPRVSLMPSGEGHFGNMTYLALNLASPNQGGALAQLPVRQAIELAIDKRAVARLSGGPGAARPLRQAVASTVAGFRTGADHFVTLDDKGDPQAARRLLAEAGHPDGLELRLAYNANGIAPMQAQALQASLLRAGLRAEVRAYPSSDFFGRLLPNPENAKRGEWDLALANWVPDWFGPTNGRSVISPLFDGRTIGPVSMNYGRYRSGEVNGAIDAATTAASPELAERAWFAAARQVMLDAAIVPVIERRSGYMRSARVRNCRWMVTGLQCDPTAIWLADAPGARP
jgi:peptide/nickel transport system substrate-binding protein